MVCRPPIVNHEVFSEFTMLDNHHNGPKKAAYHVDSCVYTEYRKGLNNIGMIKIIAHDIRGTHIQCCFLNKNSL